MSILKQPGQAKHQGIQQKVEKLSAFQNLIFLKEADLDYSF